MAEADEDAMPQTGWNGKDVDLSDETQDFRFLTSISREDATIPKRGEKDFEPHATNLQLNTLAASRQAMQNALSFQRVHAPKTQMIAQYHPDTNLAFTNNPKGPLFQRMGHVLPPSQDPLGDDDQRGQRIWLWPEEALWLLERGTLDIRWPAADDEECGALGLPMSLQAAYAMFLGDEESHGGALTFEKYAVYASLKRMGYTVLRAPTFDHAAIPAGEECYAPPTATAMPIRAWQPGLFALNRLCALFFSLSTSDSSDSSAEIRQREGPLIPPGLYRDYDAIYRRLALIGFYDPTSSGMCRAHSPPLPPTTTTTGSPADSSFRITFFVWKPGCPHFKKSRPVDPDFRIAVLDARHSRPPTLSQMAALFDSTPYAPALPHAQMYAKLKLGYKNVILAVVDQGITSYLRLADAAFGLEKIYQRRTAKATGAGGKRGGRGRGRGRGR